MAFNDTTAPQGASSELLDMGPLAWVLDEVRQAVTQASRSLRRHAEDTEDLAPGDLLSADTTQLRVARQHLHQAAGAVAMVGHNEAATMLRAMESATQRCVEDPAAFSLSWVSHMERAGFALLQFLDLVLQGKPASAVALFPQYRDVLAITGQSRVHPADLWPYTLRWATALLTKPVAAIPPGSLPPGRFEQAVLRLMKTEDADSARWLRDTCAGFSVAATNSKVRGMWQVAAAFFDALACRALAFDVHVKRTVSRLMQQHGLWAKGDASAPERLVLDLLFFCGQAGRATGGQLGDGDVLAEVRHAFGLQSATAVTYEQSVFGQFDPSLLQKARKRIAVAKDAWSSVASGDMSRVRSLLDHFNLVADSVIKLLPDSQDLASNLIMAVDTVARTNTAPTPALAMEVATCIMYLDAVFEDFDPADTDLSLRVKRLTQRLRGVLQGGDAQPLESWIEGLYRRVSDRQTMGSVVGELRNALADLERSLDQYFRQPQDAKVLANVPSQLMQMRGVVSVLGLDSAMKAVQRMREGVEQLLLPEASPDQLRASGLFDNLGNNLGALGLMFDMLSHQPELARQLFYFDTTVQELTPLMGRQREEEVAAPTGVELELPIAPAADAQEPAVVEAPASTLPMEVEDVAAPVAPAPAPAPAVAEPVVESLPEVVLDAPPLQPAALSSAPAPLSPQPGWAAAPPDFDPSTYTADLDSEDGDLLDVFLEEASDVVTQGLAAVEALSHAPDSAEHLTALRRAFHTLKGSARMVGLDAFGESAWALEQVLNTWVADRRPATAELRTLAIEALTAFGSWASDIRDGRAHGWGPEPFQRAAEAMRVERRLLPIGQAQDAPVPSAAPPVGATEAPVQVVGVSVHEPSLLDDLTLAFGAPPDVLPPLPEPLASEPGDTAQDGALAIDLSAFRSEQAQPAPALDNTLVAPEQADEIAAESRREAPVQPESAPEPMDHAGTEYAEFPPDESAIGLADASLPADVPEAVELEPGEAIDLSMFEVHGVAPDLPATETPVEQPLADLPTLDALPTEPEVPAAELVAPVSEKYRMIGGLQVNIALYNVYLSEADEWSRRLQTELDEWAIERLDRPLSESTESLAHSLAGSSATVGFESLSQLSRQLEHAVRHTRAKGGRSEHEAQVYVDAADEIRRLLHQFAAGFLKEPNADVVQALANVHAAPPVEAPAHVVANAEAREPAVPAVDVTHIPAATPPAVDVLTPPAQPVLATPASATPVPASAIATARPVPLQFAGDESHAAHGELDADLFPVFDAEASELLPALGAAMRQWVARPDNRSARSEVLRLLHTIKGSARSVGAMGMGELAHRIETTIEGLDESADPRALQALLSDADALEPMLDRLRQGEVVAVPAPQLVEPVEPASPSPAAAVARELAPTLPAPVAGSVVTPLVRVKSRLLDNLVNQTGEVMMTRSRMESEATSLRTSLSDLATNLERLRQQLREFELQAELQMQSRLAHRQDVDGRFDPLEMDRFTRVQELTRLMAESVDDVATVQRTMQRSIDRVEGDLAVQSRQARELQYDLLRTRMVEFDAISERLYRVVRQAAKDSSRQVRLDVVGGAIEIDRGVLDRMTPSFEHLLRNAVAHGIESAKQRAAAGKPEVGLIQVTVQHERNDVAISFSDDGAGLDVATIRHRAQAQGLIKGDDALSHDDLVRLIFTPGFTTAEAVTELAGRGIGMDVVRAEVLALGGRVDVNFEPGKGTRFTLVLPLTTAVTQVVTLRVGQQVFGVPASLVVQVHRSPQAALQSAYQSNEFSQGPRRMPFYWGGALVRASAASTDTPERTATVVELSSAQQHVAIHVDEVQGNQEVVIKKLGPQLSSLPGLAGMTVLPSGDVLLIYNPVALASVYGEQALALQRTAAGQTDLLAREAAPKAPLVLVVDDSITVRRATQRALQREGYRVVTAVDGVQALERLRDETPALVLSDIEMPRMDGFDLLRTVRAHAPWVGLPFVFISSRTADKHRELARELGVTDYLGKPYEEQQLLALARRFTQVTASA